MYKHIFITLFLALAFAFSGFANPVAAQGIQDTGTYNNEAPATGNTDTQTGGTTNGTGGFDWRWLLPLAAVPFFFMMRSDNTDEDTTEYRQQRYAGSKGGRSTRDKNIDDDLV